MSIKIMSKVWELDLKSTEKLIFLALADHANDDGECYPSLNKICEKSGVSKRTLITTIDRLIEEGHISKEKRFRNDGSNTSNMYYLHPMVKEIHYPSENITPPSEVATLPLVKSSHPLVKQLHPINHQYNHQEETSHNHQTNISSTFDLFWSAYPKKEGKGQAEKAWKSAIKSKDFPTIEFILDSITKYKKSKKVIDGYVKNPSTWINGKCWFDEIREEDNKSKRHRETRESERDYSGTEF